MKNNNAGIKNRLNNPRKVIILGLLLVVIFGIYSVVKHISCGRVHKSPM